VDSSQTGDEKRKNDDHEGVEKNVSSREDVNPRVVTDFNCRDTRSSRYGEMSCQRSNALLALYFT
jgi:hypothetical protein